jgi:hypothetical protein
MSTAAETQKHNIRFVAAGLFLSGLLGATLLIYCLFHGFFDTGSFQILQTLRAGKNVAMIATRTDQEALGGYEEFVLVSDHAYSSKELRHAYYYDGLLFRAGRDCLNVKWVSPKELSIECKDGTIVPEGIAVEKKQQNELTVTYVNVPEKQR